MPRVTKPKTSGVPAKSNGHKKTHANASDPLKWPVISKKENLHCREVEEDQIIVIDNFLDDSECAAYERFIGALNLTITPLAKRGEADRVNDRISIESAMFAETLYKVLEPHIRHIPSSQHHLTPPALPSGLNPNIRLYRYSKGQYFGPHYDDSISWNSPSGQHSWSEWTLLIYVTGFENGVVDGETVFYKPGLKKKSSPIEISTPLKRGTALLHRHGKECMLHEGREVQAGIKLVLRSDLMFSQMKEGSETISPSNLQGTALRTSSFKWRSWFRAVLSTVALFFIFSRWGGGHKLTSNTTGPDFSFLESHCAHLGPVESSEFLSRQTRLAKSLLAINASAYISEPGSNALYFANISQSVWHPSERPLLLVVSPFQESPDHEVEARITILTPHFEARRASLLKIPSLSRSLVSFVEWAEDEDPYKVLSKALLVSAPGGAGSETKPVVVLDEAMRLFVADGISKAGFSTLVYPPDVQHLREQKSAAELELLKCANEVTLLAVRAVREHMYIGMRESEGRRLIQTALAAAGLKNGDTLVLFGENAALPHGSGTDRILGVHDFALFDVGGQLHGYTSDITRTFALPGSRIPHPHLKLWYTVLAAQKAAHRTAKAGIPARRVDEVARTVIRASGNEDYFTHRLGHGIGLDGHESPYLRGGNDAILVINNTFSNEPGIYKEEEVGIRLEDCFAILGEEAKAVLFTDDVGGFARSPWLP